MLLIARRWPMKCVRQAKLIDLRAGHVDHGRVLGQVVRGLEGRVALADDEHALVGELPRIDRHVQ